MCFITRRVFPCCSRENWYSQPVHGQCTGVPRCDSTGCIFLGAVKVEAEGRCWRCILEDAGKGVRNGVSEVKLQEAQRIGEENGWFAPQGAEKKKGKKRKRHREEGGEESRAKKVKGQGRFEGSGGLGQGMASNQGMWNQGTSSSHQGMPPPPPPHRGMPPNKQGISSNYAMPSTHVGMSSNQRGTYFNQGGPSNQWISPRQATSSAPMPYIPPMTPQNLQGVSHPRMGGHPQYRAPSQPMQVPALPSGNRQVEVGSSFNTLQQNNAPWMGAGQPNLEYNPPPDSTIDPSVLLNFEPDYTDWLNIDLDQFLQTPNMGDPKDQAATAGVPNADKTERPNSSEQLMDSQPRVMTDEEWAQILADLAEWNPAPSEVEQNTARTPEASSVPARADGMEQKSAPGTQNSEQLTTPRNLNPSMTANQHAQPRLIPPNAQNSLDNSVVTNQRYDTVAQSAQKTPRAPESVDASTNLNEAPPGTAIDANQKVAVDLAPLPLGDPMTFQSELDIFDMIDFSPWSSEETADMIQWPPSDPLTDTGNDDLSRFFG